MKWEVKKLGEVCQLVGGGTPSKSNSDFYLGSIPWATVRDMKTEIITKTDCLITEEAVKKSSTNIISSGNVVIATRVGLGKVCLLAQDTAINQDLRAIIPLDNNQLLEKFIFWWAKSIAHLIEKEGTGATVQGVKVPFVKSLKIPIPPLEEQKRIVEILDESFAGIERAEAIARQNLTNASELFDSYLNKIFLDFVERNNTQTLNCITDLIVDCEHKTAPTQETGFPSIRTPNIGKGHLILDNVYRVSEEVYEQWTKRAKPQPGDLILAREAPAGNVGVIPEGERVCLGQRTVLIRPKKNINPQYLAFFLLHSKMQERLLSKSSGATVQHVNMKDIRALRIGDLPPIEIQNRIIKSLLDIQEKSKKLEEIYQRKIEALGELKQSILQKAFSGQLTQ